MTLCYSKVFLRLHWGYAIRKRTTKAKPAFLLPPPTTLIGALSFYRYRGIENVLFNKKSIESPAFYLKGVKATAKLSSFASYVEDIIRNVIFIYQRKERQLDPLSRYNIISEGKVYSPGGMLIVVYIANTLAKEELEKMSWSIARIGSKESVVSVEDVEVGEASKVSGVIETDYYFPATVSVVEKEEFINLVPFWDEKAYIFDQDAKKEAYMLPLRSYPIISTKVKVNAKEAYKVGDEYVVFA